MLKSRVIGNVLGVPVPFVTSQISINISLPSSETIKDIGVVPLYLVTDFKINEKV